MRCGLSLAIYCALVAFGMVDETLQRIGCNSGLFIAARGEDWTGWRGPRGDGISQEANAPVRWSSNENIRWKTRVPGVGLSSPIACRDSVFVTSYLPHDQSRQLVRMDRVTGNIVWSTVVHQGPLENQHKFNTSASATPTTDGASVYCVFVDDMHMVVAAVNWDGEIVWKKSPGGFFSRHGFASSPILCDEGLVVNGHQDGEAFVVLLDPANGDEIWRYKPDSNLRSFSTPLVASIEGERQVVLSGAGQTLGLDPKSGIRLWYVEGPTEKIVCTPSIGLGNIYSFGGSPDARAFAIQLGGRGDVTKSHIAWQLERGMPYVPTPLLYDKYLHIIDDLGIYTCLEPETGRVLKSLRKGGNTYSSPIGVTGRVYMFDDSGTCTVIANDDRFTVLAKNTLDEPVQTTPAFSEGSLYIRGEAHVWRISEDSAALR